MSSDQPIPTTGRERAVATTRRSFQARPIAGAAALVLALVVALSLAAAPAVMARPAIPGPVPAVVRKVVDGDTVRVAAEVWPGQVINATVRLAGIAAPELRSRCALERQRASRARDHLANALKVGTAVVLRDIKAGKYFGRVIARIEQTSGSDVGEMMLAQNHASPYRGRRSPVQCDGEQPSAQANGNAPVRQHRTTGVPKRDTSATVDAVVPRKARPIDSARARRASRNGAGIRTADAQTTTKTKAWPF